MPPITRPATHWYRYIYQELQKTYGDHSETDALTRRLLEAYLHYTPVDHLLDRPLTLTPDCYHQLTHALDQLAHHTPIQYILGHVDFAHCRLSLNRHVLIPRPETEEMVLHLLKNHNPCTPILDIGTGSGAIAIAIAKAWPTAYITALDISPQALELARQNAEKNDVTLHTLHLDILHQDPPPSKWQLMISNPPYIPLQEQSQMPTNVICHEPHAALFVPTHDPLLFYRRIADIAQQELAPRGLLYTEVHEDYADQVAALYQKYSFLQIRIHHDLYDKPRWITAQASP